MKTQSTRLHLRHWRKLWERSDELVYFHRKITSIHIKAAQSGGRGSTWYGQAWFGNCHFPVAGLKIHRFGPFPNKKIAKRFILRWMRTHKGGGHYPYMEKKIQ